MTKFFNTLKKTIFYQFPQFFGHKNFLLNIRVHMDFQDPAKSPRSNSKKTPTKREGRMERQKDRQ